MIGDNETELRPLEPDVPPHPWMEGERPAAAKPRLRDVFPGWHERLPKVLIALAVLIALVPLAGIPLHWEAANQTVRWLDAAVVLVAFALLV